MEGSVDDIRPSGEHVREDRGRIRGSGHDGEAADKSVEGRRAANVDTAQDRDQAAACYCGVEWHAEFGRHSAEYVWERGGLISG